MPNPAECLEGLSLVDGWTVGKLEARSPQASGSNFSKGYRATRKDGTKAFVKALDFQRAFNSGADLTKVLQHVTELFNYELEMLQFCEQKRMDRVVRAIGSGILDVDGTPLGQVPYLIFEDADCDVRAHLDNPKHGTGLAWKLRSLHHICTGLKQLHSSDAFHQDLKPSNVFVFNAEQKERVSKLGDLGRASRSGVHSPFDHLDWPGDPKYAPPEFHYNFILPDLHERRIAYDIYLLGSLTSFMFIRTTATAGLWQALDNQFWPGNWMGTFELVLPALDHAFAEACIAFKKQLPTALAADLLPIYSQLCAPDPRKRGYPGQALNKVALERFITKFDMMARKADIGRYEGA